MENIKQNIIDKLNPIWVDYQHGHCYQKNQVLLAMDEYLNKQWKNSIDNEPPEDCLLLVSNGNFVEICYYENKIFYKPFRYDDGDRPTFNEPEKNLSYLIINLPKCECHNLAFIESNNSHVCLDCNKEYPETFFNEGEQKV